MIWYFEVLKKYAQFSGRARRKEYWYFVLFNAIVSIILQLIGIYAGIPIISTLYSLAVLIPSLAVGVRRMHDLGKSGWFYIIPIYDIILACLNGNVGPNEYGEDPKGGIAYGATDYERPVDVNV